MMTQTVLKKLSKWCGYGCFLTNMVLLEEHELQDGSGFPVPSTLCPVLYTLYLRSQTPLLDLGDVGVC